MKAPAFLEGSLSALGFHARAKGVEVRGDERGWVLRGTSDRRWTYAGGDALDLVDRTDTHFAAIDPHLADAIADRRSLVWRRDAKTFVLPPTVELPHGPHAVEPLSSSDAETVDRHWEHRDDRSLAYIRECLARDPAVGVRLEGRLAGWELVHDDGALGAAFVLPEVRRRGVMRSIQWAMVSALRERGLPAFKHVALDNHGWLEAQAPAGWRSVRTSAWFEVAS